MAYPLRIERRGHESKALLARHGYPYRVAPSSRIAAAKKNYSSNSNLSFRKQDIFKFLQTSPRAFQGIFEHTIFCAIDPGRRIEFIEKTHGALQAGGRALRAVHAERDGMRRARLGLKPTRVRLRNRACVAGVTKAWSAGR